MPRERLNLPPPLKKNTDDIQVGDRVMVLRNTVLGSNEPCLAQVIEIKQSENISATNINEREKEFEGISDHEEGQKFLNDENKDGNKILYYVHYFQMDRRLDEWINKDRIIEAAYADPDSIPQTPGQKSGGFLTRSQRRLNEDFFHVPKAYENMDAFTRKLEMEHEQRTKVKNVDKVQFGEWEIDAWYFSPFPLSMVINQSKLYFCEYCLWYTSNQMNYACHMLHQCKIRKPNGKIIYEDGSLAVWEVKGKNHKEFCQSLCLLSKLFLDHKTLYYDVEGFIFYVLCELGEQDEAHMVGHFSKELNSANNLACIMVLPPYQRNGYGKLLIQISYSLSEQEGIIGTPEKPLSDLGKVSYRSYWWWVLIGVLDKELGSGRIEAGSISVSALSQLSGIHVDDIAETFKTLNLIKYWRGDHVIRINRKIISQIKQLHVFHPPKLLLRRNAMHFIEKKSGSNNYWNPENVDIEIDTQIPP